jgi:hypothetical protein
MYKWSKWRPFPDPRKGGLLVAPFGPGCYKIKHGSDLILFGSGGHLASRMTSLLPPPWGSGTRNNFQKRRYLLKHLAEIEYQTLACTDPQEAKEVERAIAARRAEYRFPT